MEEKVKPTVSIDKKKKIQNICLRIFSLILMFALSYSYACYVFMPKTAGDSTYYTSRSFKVEKKNTIDILCIGSSAIECP